jgi:ribosomal-protein-alanine N-acetyltransferase
MAFCCRLPYIFSVLYRLYEADDFPQLYALEEACFPASLRFPRRYMEQLLVNPASAAWIAEGHTAGASRQLTGFAIVDWVDSDGQIVAYIQTLEVSPEHRRRGVGSELLRCIELSARAAGAGSIWLHVAEANEAALRLYHAHGFIPQGREEDYYQRGGHAVVYARPIEFPVRS